MQAKYFHSFDAKDIDLNWRRGKNCSFSQNSGMVILNIKESISEKLTLTFIQNCY